MADHGQLAEYLQAMRARVRPEDVGLETYGERRRVPGLRREEVASLAGVSASYYIRLEQGQSANASDAWTPTSTNTCGCWPGPVGAGACSARRWSECTR
jgi:hypothetical protein